MADEDLIFRLEGVDGGQTPRTGHGGDSDTDSEDEEGYFICPITDDPRSHQHVNVKVNACYGDLTKSGQYGSSGSPASSFNFKEAWKHAIEKAKHMPDPWAEFHLEDIATECATRHRYNAVTGEWLEDEVLIKMASQPFGRGAMRECFRTKKLSNFLHTQQWKGASNYVAKRYVESVGRDVYFEDVRLQMEAKLWGEEYNRHKPPKQVCVAPSLPPAPSRAAGGRVQRPGRWCHGHSVPSPSQAVAHGNRHLPSVVQKVIYSPKRRVGVVQGGLGCLRPISQVGSSSQSAKTTLRGTEEKCGSPRVRTLSGSRPPLLLRLSENSGDENMSDVTFDSLPSSPSSATPHSQKLEPLHWPVFADLDNLGPRDHDHLDNHRLILQQSAKTTLRGTEEKCGSPRVRTLSGSRPPLLLRLSENSGDENMSDVTFDSLPSSPSSATPHSQKLEPLHWPVFADLDNLGPRDHDHLDNHRDSENGGDSGYPSEKRGELDDPEPREHGHSNGSRRYESDEDSLGSCGRVTPVTRSPRHSRVANTCSLRQVHLAMVRYHEAGRFCQKGEAWDRVSAVFHLQHAADLGELEAVVGLGLMCSRLPHHILPDVSLQETEENQTRGFNYLLKAAEAGDRQSMILVARAFDTGQNLSPDRSRDWPEALHWYSTALERTDYDEGGEYDGMQDEPRHALLAREAEMLSTGGCGLQKDPQRAGDLYTQAAEAATEAMKGRLATQYYEKAEEAWAQMQE
ncbi:eukaryotic elongation factor 2 kinase [Pteropus vampyrus]|uniref:Eukaryotic elongation factor 2 kinase n=1 Tax=Pteropus vampyrus TaxID=132908 RepID=A0A6P6BLA5_PTEVA|nr:eukaryotic elongation factor 2 kinase [Pteropus vampyrus]